MRKTTPAPSIDRLREVLSFDETAGEFYWKKRIGRSVVGDLAGSVRSNGYRSINIDGVRYYNHRLVWFVAHGSMPKNVIDHIDGNKLNNRPVNLRDVPDKLNFHNRTKKNPNNTTGYAGVTYNKSVGKFAAQIMINRKHCHLGLFDSPEDASVAYKKAKFSIGVFPK